MLIPYKLAQVQQAIKENHKQLDVRLDIIETKIEIKRTQLDAKLDSILAKLS